MPTKPSLAVHIVTWNSVTHIPTCLGALAEQLQTDVNVMIVDNASVDGTVTWIEERYPQFHILRNTRNLGYCRGHNQALRLTESDFVLVMNPDVVLRPGWIERGITYLTTHPEAAAFGGKTLRYTYSNDELKEVVPSGIIDSTGLVVYRNRHTVDRGSGMEDRGQWDEPGEVFGLSGALVLYRRAALESIRWRDEYFDNDIFAYKDDLDLSWRLQRLGWTVWYDPQATALHYRQVKGVSATSDRLIAKNHRSRSRFNTFYSYRNHWLVLVKNETWSTFWRDWPWIIIYEIKKAIWLLVTGQPVFNAARSSAQRWSIMRQKAAMIRHQAKRSSLATRQWFL